MFWTAVYEWRQKRKLRELLRDPRAARGFRSTGQLEKGIAAAPPNDGAIACQHRCEKVRSF
jgi:hypothetical protein